MASFETVPIEEVRSFWNRRPCNIRHSTSEVGTKTYFDEVEERKYRVEPHIPAFAEFERWNGKRVLELGCGIGTDTINFARAGAQVTAVDLSDESLAIARQRAEVFGLADRITFHHANGEKLSDSVPVEAHDLVYSFGVVHHTPHPERALRELRRYLKPGGRLKIMVYYRYAWKVLWIVLGYGRGRFWQIPELVARYSEAQSGCPVTYIYNKTEGRNLVESAGFKMTDVAVDHIFSYRIPDYVEYRYVKEWYFRWMPESLFRALEQRFGWHLLIDAVAPDR